MTKRKGSSNIITSSNKSRRTKTKPVVPVVGIKILSYKIKNSFLPVHQLIEILKELAAMYVSNGDLLEFGLASSVTQLRFHKDAVVARLASALRKEWMAGLPPKVVPESLELKRLILMHVGEYVKSHLKWNSICLLNIKSVQKYVENAMSLKLKQHREFIKKCMDIHLNK